MEKPLPMGHRLLRQPPVARQEGVGGGEEGGEGGEGGGGGGEEGGEEGGAGEEQVVPEGGPGPTLQQGGPAGGEDRPVELPVGGADGGKVSGQGRLLQGQDGGGGRQGRLGGAGQVQVHHRRRRLEP